MADLALYLGMVSFNLRPNPDGRMFIIGGSLIIGTVLGGLIYPRLHAWAVQNGKTPRRLFLIPWLLVAVATVLPGFEQYVFNQPLRIAANIALGMINAPTYLIFFQRFPAKWRGTCFGLCLAVGLLVWHVVLSLARAHSSDGGGGYHPFLPLVYITHCLSIIVLAGVSLYLIVVEPRPARDDIPYFQPASESSRHAQILLFFIAGIAVYFLNGTLSARLTPTIPTSSIPLLIIWGSMAAVFAVPVAGWLLDRWPERMFRRILTVCCVLFVLTPALAVLEYTQPIYTVLLAASTTAQFVFFCVCSVTVAGLSPTVEKAALYNCLIYSFRLVSVFGYLLWTRVFFVGQGMSVLIAVGLAYAVSRLSRRLDVVRAGVNSPSHHQPIITAVRGPSPEKLPDEEVTAAFLRSCKLTPRELEAASLLLEDVPIRNISRIMGIGEGTVKKHTANIYRKYNVSNRHEFSRACTHYSAANASPAKTDASDDETPHQE
ncbi:MAG: LuxR family transcriptional regulator [Planctomycetaceae bacterium]|nr:LuxR family transcriptional regulator [Planctomycetaceae bacterium]